MAKGAILDIFDATSQRTLLVPQCWGKRAILIAPGNQSRGLRLSQKTVLTKDGQERGTKRSGGALQCERRARLTGSSARSGLLKTTATAEQLRLTSKIDGPSIH